MDKNHKREDVVVKINNEDYRLRLTLGGMAALEQELGCKTITDLQQRLSEPSMTDIQTMAGILIRGGGEKVDEGFFMTADVEIPALLAGIMEAMSRAFGKGDKEAPSGNGVKG